MQSFRTELENPVVEKDILELERKISDFHQGKIDEEKFRSLRLARGVYGQRQPGVQMIRIKLPFGKVTSEQLHRIANVSDEYSTGRLHITTRQDIQIHYVSLDRTPQLWEELEKDEITIREACGNAVRNVTASETAGIDINEPFDVTPYADAVFKYFLRNPICQEMGRKFKIAFSATEKDTALTFLQDLGFIPKLKSDNGKTERGFKVLIAGGLGSQPRGADVAYEFLPANKIIPFTEGVLRVFDRYGERKRRLKARMKFLFNDIGLDGFLKRVEEEQKAVKSHLVEIDTADFEPLLTKHKLPIFDVEVESTKAYKNWKQLNVIQQKQEGYAAIGIKVPLGDFYTDKARKLADLIKNYAGNELRFTLRQNILIRNVQQELLPFFYQELKGLGFAEAGYNSIADITACPGTDTCNLGIANSTSIALELEKVLKEEYPQYLTTNDLTIKISGCMNSCGQHMMAHIGFQGMTVKSGVNVAPALQVLLGGSTLGDGEGRFADKVIKIPSKRGPEALRQLLDDYEAHNEDETFIEYYDRQTDRYFYNLLKPLADVDSLTPEEFIDWGSDTPYKKAIGLGECAGVIVDLVATLLFDSQEKIDNAVASINEEKWADSIYHSYSSMINTAKALLLSEQKQTNTQAGIVKQFDEVFGDNKQLTLKTSFSELVFQLQHNEPSQQFATDYLLDAKNFLKAINVYREKQLLTQ